MLGTVMLTAEFYIVMLSVILLNVVAPESGRGTGGPGEGGIVL
jgi:hypothetical protein